MAREGFSLIEVMIALGVVVFALVALCGLLSSGLKVARQAKTELFAAQVASSLLAERRAAPWLSCRRHRRHHRRRGGPILEELFRSG